MPLTPAGAATLGHYRIVEKIGAGGMGEVYRAHDQHLDREVAIKVLPPGLLADEPARKRFRKEALALSRLNHPNIETVHDFDTEKGVDFLVLEYVPGVGLDEKLAAGALPEKEIARLGLQLAEALAAAHEQGIIHRDLKPANLRLTSDGRLKVLDFGLAKLVHPAQLSAPTESVTAGRFSGTLPYMAPEQLREEPLDGRTDIWAAGAVLYEMATGRRPFCASGVQLIDEILHAAPALPRSADTKVAAALESVILKCLEKDPNDRYQSARELAVDLRRLGGPVTQPTKTARRPEHGRRAWLTGVGLLILLIVLASAGVLILSRARERRATAVPEIKSIAVLPLTNLSADSTQEYFADGMTETLITELSKISALKVISRTSVMRYKKTDKTLPQIARELNVDGVVEGSVLRAGDRVRVTAQLIHAGSDRHLWAESYDRDLRDVLALHSELARAIAAQIKVKLTPQEQSDLGHARIVNPQAHEAYLKGRFYMVKDSPEPLNKARDYFQQAISSDPTFAPAYAGLAHAHWKLGFFGDLRSPTAVTSAFTEAKAVAERAVALDERLAEAHGQLCAVLVVRDWDWTNAERECRRSVELDPGSADVRRYLALYQLAAGRRQEAIEQAERARLLDPLNTEIGYVAELTFFFARDYDRALEQARRVIEIDPNLARVHLVLASAYEQKGMHEAALREYARWLNLRGATPAEVAELEKAFRTGAKEFGRWRVDDLQRQSKKMYTTPIMWALAFSYMRDADQTLAWLERAYRERDGTLAWFKADPRFDFLRADPRFQDLMRRIGTPSK